MTIRTLARGRSGQSIFRLMLLLAAVALAIGAFFPLFEYLTQFRGPTPALKPMPKLLTTADVGQGATTTTVPAPAENAAPAPAATDQAKPETPAAPAAPAAPAPAAPG